MQLESMLLKSPLEIFFFKYYFCQNRWHLGFCNEAYLPTRRGFDSFRGPYLGALEFYSHNRKPTGM